MTARTRKLIGTIVFLLCLALYATAAAVIGSGRIALAPQWVQFAFFVTAGLAWVIPAGSAHPLDAETRTSAYAALTSRKRFHSANGAPDR